MTALVAGAAPAMADRSPKPTGPPKPTGSPVPNVAAGIGVKLLDAPVNRRADSRAHQYIVDHVEPGTTIRRRIVVVNRSEIERQVDLYPAAAEVTDKGFVFAPDRVQNELSSWVTPDRSRATLDEDGEARVWVTISVPRNASASERYGVVWAEVGGTFDPHTNVRNVGRAGIRIYLSVGPGGEPPSDFQIGGLNAGRGEDGIPTVTAEVRNTGQRALDLTGELSLSDGPGGLTTGPVRAEAITLGLGGTATVRVRLDPQLPDGPWTARLAVASGWTKRSATATITFGRPTPTTSPASNSRQLLFGGIGMSTLILAVLFGYAYLRRNRPEQPMTAR